MNEPVSASSSRSTYAAWAWRFCAVLGAIALLAAPVAFLLSGLLHWSAAYRAAGPLAWGGALLLAVAATVWWLQRGRVGR
jgi:hypothetical protein